MHNSLLSRPLVRYGIAGSTTAGVYFGVTLLLSSLGIGIQLAIVLGWLCSLCVHFTLQRFFVFRSAEGFHLAIEQQLTRYLATAVVQYAATAALTALLPGALGVDERAVYVMVAIVAAAVVFFILRFKVFHEPAGED